MKTFQNKRSDGNPERKNNVQHAFLHKKRQQEILAEFPRVKELYGTDNRTQLYAYICIALQISLAWTARSSFVLAILLGISVGPYINAGILSFMHEATHMLIFKRPAFNRIISIAANVPMLVPISEIFRQHHYKHHCNLGDDNFDVDVPTDFEVSLVKNISWRKALWLMFNMIILPLRSVSRLPVRRDIFLVLNWISCISFAVFSFLFSKSTFLYLFLSLLNSQGLHPANTRQIQRHIYDGDENLKANGERPTTYSYYGIGNAFTLNVGYHVEHHDFNRIPWSRLPLLREIAGHKWYPNEKAYHNRGISALVNFVINQNISLQDFAH